MDANAEGPAENPRESSSRDEQYLRWEKYCNDLWDGNPDSEFTNTRFDPKTGQFILYSKDGSRDALPAHRLIAVIVTTYKEQKTRERKAKLSGVVLRLRSILESF